MLNMKEKANAIQISFSESRKAENIHLDNWSPDSVFAIAGLTHLMLLLFALSGDGHGINSHKVSEYEKRISEGAILMIVTSTPPRLDEAQRTLKATKAVGLQQFAVRLSEEVGG